MLLMSRTKSFRDYSSNRSSSKKKTHQSRHSTKSKKASEGDDIAKLKPSQHSGYPSAPPASAGPLPPKIAPDEIDFPEIPGDSPFGSGVNPSPGGSKPHRHNDSANAPAGDDLDFDDLAKRFDQLKKKK